MKRVLIAGCGYVGTHLASRLIRAGHEVWGMRRHAEKLPHEIHPVGADVRDEKSLRDLPGELQELDAVVYAVSAPSRDDEGYEAAYVTGPRNLIEALEAQGMVPTRFLYTSSTGVYGQTDGSWVDESSPTSSDTFVGHRLLEGEAMARAIPTKSCVVRFGGIYGPGRTRLIEQVRDGEAFVVDGETSYMNRIHVDDCAGILDHLIQAVEIDRLYLGVDSQPAERGEVLRWLATELEVDPPRVIPADEAPEPTRRRGAGKRCKNSRILDAGYRFQYPTFREGYRKLIHEPDHDPFSNPG